MACTMLGGTVVEDEEEARALSAIPETEDGPGKVEVGDEVELPPCLPPLHLAEIERQKGRPCPRPGVRMDPDNEVPLELMQLSFSEYTRHFVGPMLRETVARDERLSVMRRVAGALRDPVITARLYPKTEEEE